MDQQQASPSISSDVQQSANQHVPSQAKPRARLGPTEVVQLPASDSEPDDEDGNNQETDAGGDGSPDFLKDYPEDTEDLQLLHLRLKTPLLVPLNFPRFGNHLKRLCLRQNELTSPLPSGAFANLTELEELDFYDNRLGPHVRDEELAGCPNISTLDLSFNNIRHAPSLPSLQHVNTLYLVQNKISRLEKGLGSSRISTN
ncbi:hypothetical protein CNBD2740 [Cryptococcus deneoformans B-3501A]|uniref:hypothetical protein n=1 Tax=Cryptococcus deneoformans (strain B-3501A) TaxID=283643 RepID=UPI000042F7A4|nr:hypothetical protein CNBD2740 [Cryptococcus neoformans var. neoformans B-3501A]EAL21219.1 hypothetical protein CNBD2740 [Cryptococcus neoformans var. neoformans B-3501A]